ncbi:MAG: hypothetical protein PVI90_19220 [Desulfobacteraceae bacterium]|jgi:hypothetical protein
MENPKSIHLTQDQLMQAALDETQLSKDLKEHLSSCDACNEQKTILSHRLNNLKELSKRISTQSKPWYHFTSSGRETSPRPFSLKFMLIIAMVAALILMLNLYDPFRLKSYERKKQLNPIPSDTTGPSAVLDPLPEIYAGLINLAATQTPWWQDKTYIRVLKLTSDEVKTLETIWTAASATHLRVKQALFNRQVDLSVTLEGEDRDEKVLYRQYQDLLQDFNRLTNQRFELLINIRNILGDERFQMLLRLQMK